VCVCLGIVLFVLMFMCLVVVSSFFCFVCACLGIVLFVLMFMCLVAVSSFFALCVFVLVSYSLS
jgi:hypothetical protein